MSTRRLRNLSEQAAKVQDDIQTLEKLVQLKDTVTYINDDTVAQQTLFPSSLEIWKKIVAAQIQLYKLREKEKRLRKEFEKEQNRIIDFSVLDKYRKFPHKHVQKTDTEKPEDANTQEEKRKSTKKDPGFMIKFSLSNAYEAIRRQEQILTRPHLPPFIEKATKSGPAYFYYDREEKQWKRFFPHEDEIKEERRNSQHPRIIDGRGLPFFMQQQINKLNKRPRNAKRLPSISFSTQPSKDQTLRDRKVSMSGQDKGQEFDSRFPSASVPSQLVPSRETTFIAKRPSEASTVSVSDSWQHQQHHQIMEESQELLSDINHSSSSLPNLDVRDFEPSGAGV